MPLDYHLTDTGDYKLTNGVFNVGNYIKNYIDVMLFSHARASKTDITQRKYRRGWIGNVYLQKNEQIGSLLWLLTRQTNISAALYSSIENEIYKKLQFLLDKKLCKTISVSIGNQERDGTQVVIVVDGQRFTFKP